MLYPPSPHDLRGQRCEVFVESGFLPGKVFAADPIDITAAIEQIQAEHVFDLGHGFAGHLQPPTALQGVGVDDRWAGIWRDGTNMAVPGHVFSP